MAWRVEPQSETVWRQADRYQVAYLLINTSSTDRADF